MNGETLLILERIRALSSRDEDFDQLLEQMHKLAALAPVSIGTVLPSGTSLYRGTSHHTEIPGRIEEIWYPPAAFVRDFGRANRPGSPVFYCCSDPTGAFLEVRVAPGKYAVLATWITTRQMILHDVGYSSGVFMRAGAMRSLPERHSIFYSQSLTPGAREVRDFLSLAFTDPTVNHYRVTAAIAAMFFACDDIVGILYPSVAKSGDVDNIALAPEFVHLGVRLAEASLIYVDDVTPEGVGGSSLIARLASDRDGKLVWDFISSTTTDIPGRSAVVMHIQPGERKRITTSGQLQIDGRTYDLRPGYSIELADDEIVVRDLQGSVIQPVS